MWFQSVPLFCPAAEKWAGLLDPQGSVLVLRRGRHAGMASIPFCWARPYGWQESPRARHKSCLSIPIITLQSKRETKTQGEFRYKWKNKKNQSIHCLLKFSVMFLHTQRFKDLEGMAPLRLGRAGPGPVSCLRASAELATCWALLISGVVTLGLDRSFRPSLVEPVQENGCGLCSDGGN